MAEQYLTIRDSHGASLALERDEAGATSAWIAPPGDNDGHSVVLAPAAISEVIAFLAEPAVDFDGDQMWMDPDGRVQYVTAEDAQDLEAVDGSWRRLYVAPQPAGRPILTLETPLLAAEPGDGA